MSAAVAIALHAVVSGTSPATVEVGGRTIAWSDLSSTHFEPGRQTLRFDAPGVDAIEIPPCAGRGRVTIGGTPYAPPPGPFVVRTRGAVEIEIAVSSYEQRFACGYAPRLGKTSDTREGLGAFSNGVVFVPSGHDLAKPAAVLVGLHPWDGSPWTYAAYAELLAAAQKNDVVLLFPNGLGNSLYTRAAELEVVREMDALAQAIAVDPRRVSIWGASKRSVWRPGSKCVLERSDHAIVRPPTSTVAGDVPLTTA